MDLKFSDREELLKKTVGDYADKEIPPYMEAMEETCEFPVEVLKGMGRMGILGVITAPEYGGSGMGALARVIVLEQLGRVCPAIPMAIQVHHMCTYVFSTWGTEEQKKKYLPRLCKGDTMGVVAVTDPSGGSDVAGMQTTAKLDGDKYILNGRKCFITNAHHADIWVVIASTGEGGKGLSAFIVEKDFPGAKVTGDTLKLSLRL